MCRTLELLVETFYISYSKVGKKCLKTYLQHLYYLKDFFYRGHFLHISIQVNTCLKYCWPFGYEGAMDHIKMFRLRLELTPWSPVPPSNFLLKSCFLKKKIFFEKMWEFFWENKAHIFIPKYVQIGIFQNSDWSMF